VLRLIGLDLRLQSFRQLFIGVLFFIHASYGTITDADAFR
jgi:hypothetical protein